MQLSPTLNGIQESDVVVLYVEPFRLALRELAHAGFSSLVGLTGVGKSTVRRFRFESITPLTSSRSLSTKLLGVQ